MNYPEEKTRTVGETESVGNTAAESVATAVEAPATTAEAPAKPRRRLGGSSKRAIAAVALLAASLGFLLITARFPEWISTSYKHFSRFVIHAMGTLFAAAPFSVVEWLIYIAIVGVLAAIVVTIIRSIKLKHALRRWAKLGSCLLLAASIIFSMFAFCWAPNYRSAGLAYELGLEVRERSSDTLAAALAEIVYEMNEVVTELPADERGAVDWGGFDDQSNAARRAWQALAEENEFFADCAPLWTKPVAASRALSHAGLTGIFLPFTGEANVNADCPDSGRIFTMAHETAHAMGCAAENEANFAALLACRASDDPLARYSGLLAAFSYCYNALCSVDREAAYGQWYRLPQRAIDDYHDRGEYWARFEGEIQKVATSVNDAYLKAMNQPSGVKSYGEVVDLILADFVARTGYSE